MQGNKFRQIQMNLVCYFLLLFAGSGTVKAQLLNDSSAVKLVKEGISKIYNTQFRAAETILTSINTKYPGHPATFLYKAISIYYQNYPSSQLTPSSKPSNACFSTSIKLCESKERWELTDLFYACRKRYHAEKAESYSILSWIYNYYENDYLNAVKYSRTIHEIYPNNLMFRGEYI